MPEVGLHLDRVRISVQPAAEWAQMYREAWRLQRDHFWTPDMSSVRWDEIYVRYAPLLERVNSRSELSDLLWELQGELGTSHAYEFGGEYRKGPQYLQGFLAADWTYDALIGRYRIARLVAGDPSDRNHIAAPGARRQSAIWRCAARDQRTAGWTGLWTVGAIGAPGGRRGVAYGGGCEGNTRSVTVRTLKTERPVRYRAWVDRQQHLVHQATDGKVGYIHVPDMGPDGFAEFHRT